MKEKILTGLFVTLLGGMVLTSLNQAFTLAEEQTCHTVSEGKYYELKCNEITERKF